MCAEKKDNGQSIVLSEGNTHLSSFPIRPSGGGVAPMRRRRVGDRTTFPSQSSPFRDAHARRSMGFLRVFDT